VIGRLPAGATVERARESLRAVASRLEREHSDTNKGWSVTVVPLQEAVVGDMRRPLLVAFGAVGCVLLIACANVANLLLARGYRRRREFAVRAALGATRAHIFRQQIVESGLIAIAGGTIGVLAASWIVSVAAVVLPASLPRLDEVHINARVLAAALGMSCLTALLSGWLPAWRATRSDSRETLRAQTAPYRARGHRTGGALVAAEIAVTLALLVTACLLVKSLISLRGVDPGFNADRVVLAEVNLSQRRYAPDRWSAIYDQVVDGLAALPGVRAVGAGAPLPLSGQPGLLRFGLVIDGRPPLAAQVDRIYLRWATPGYFAAMGIPVRQGRAFSRDDRADSLPVAIVDEAFAARHFPGENALGHRVRATSDSTWREIVGVVGKVRQTSLDGDAEPHLYVAAAQFPTPAITFVVRGDGDPASLAAGVRAAVHSVDPAEPVFNVRTLRDVVSDATTPQRFNAAIIALFAGCAGLLTVLGIYGVTSRWVSDSTRELGVRIALGAGYGQILRTIVGRGLRVIAVGVVTGLVLAIVAGRLIATLLFGVSQTDPVVIAGATALVVVVTLIATLIPAQRALSVDPAISLRAS
jgi:putative ABC transport system permease protein